MSLHVPRHAPGDPVEDPNRRAAYMVDFALARLTEALEKDIEGAALVVRVGAAEGER